MNHEDHVTLLRDGIPAGGTWADLGAGSGAFTLALAELLGPHGVVYAVDRDARALEAQARAMHARFPTVSAHSVVADFMDTLRLPPLDGIVMANSLHFQRDKHRVLEHLSPWLRPGGRLIVVEYNTNRGNRWVPYPLTFAEWERVAVDCGFVGTRLLATRPSHFLGEFFSALAFVPERDGHTTRNPGCHEYQEIS